MVRVSSKSTWISLILTLCPISLIFFLWLFPRRSWNSIISGAAPADITWTSSVDNASGRPDSIPNILHYVYLFNNPTAELTFHFKHYLSLYSAWYYWRPETIYVHTNADENSLRRARDGHSSKWSQLILTHPAVKHHKVDMPTHAGNGVELAGMEHASDFVRVDVVRRLGGIYIDFDVYPLQDVRILRESGFAGIVGRQVDGNVNSGTFMARAGGRVITDWQREMNEVYNGGWTIYSNDALRRVAERLVGKEGEVLIMDKKAFAPRGWDAEYIMGLFGVHEDTASNLENVTVIDGEGTQMLVPLLPSLPDALPDDSPSWQHDYSDSYMLHAFWPHPGLNPVEGLRDVTPRYVLERQSDFSRAVYPVAKAMYDEGLLKIDDSHIG